MGDPHQLRLELAAPPGRGGEARPRQRPTPARLARFVAGLFALGALTCLGTLTVLAFLPAVFTGWASTAVSSGSMTPLIAVGDVVLVREIDEVYDLDSPTVILIERDDKVPLLHRIERRTEQGYVTRGDANEHDDGALVSPSQVLGVGRVVVPFVGYPTLWAAQGAWGHLALTAIVLTALVHLSRYGLDIRYDPWVGDEEEGEESGTPRTRPTPVPAVAATGSLLLVISASAGTGDCAAVVDSALTSRAPYANNLVRADTLNPPTGLKAVARCVPATSAPTFVGQAFKTFDAATITYPGTVKAGDLMVAVASAKNVSTMPTPTSNWKKVDEISTPGLARVGGLYYRRATADDASRPSSELPNTWGAAVTIWRGAGDPKLSDIPTAGFVNDPAPASISTGNTTWGVRETVAATFSIEAASARISLVDFSKETGEVSSSSPALTMETHYRDSGSGETDRYPQALSSKGGINFGYTFVLPVGSTRYIDLSWSASSDVYATGYAVEQPAGTPLTLVNGRTRTTYTHVQPNTGTLTYAVRARTGSWSSVRATTTVTASTC